MNTRIIRPDFQLDKGVHKLAQKKCYKSNYERILEIIEARNQIADKDFVFLAELNCNQGNFDKSRFLLAGIK